MIDYIRAELYKLVHRRDYTMGFLATMFGGILLLFFLMKETSGNVENTFDTVVGILFMALSIGLYLVVIICDMVFSDQYKNNTLKNEVSYGLPRVRIYMGKLLAITVAAFALCTLIVVFYLAVGRVLFPEETPAMELLAEMGKALAAALPLWLGGLGFFLMLLFITKGSTTASVLYVMVVAVLPGLLDMMTLFFPTLVDFCQNVKKCLLTSGFDAIQITSTGMEADLPGAWLLGLSWLAVSTAIGLAVFQKREIS